VASVERDPDVGLGDVRGVRVGVGVDGDGADAEAAAGGEDAAGDLAPVGDQNSGDHGLHPLAISARFRSLSDGKRAEIGDMTLTS
jgi:hypothetical protein